jgi:hypothetical protein
MEAGRQIWSNKVILLSGGSLDVHRQHPRLRKRENVTRGARGRHKNLGRFVHSMATAFALLFGFASGFIGAVPPGPLSIAIIRRRSENERGAFLLTGLGGALLHFMICVAIGLAVSPLLVALTRAGVSRIGLSLACAAFGFSLTRASSEASFTSDAAYPASALPSGMLIVKWILVLGTVLGITGPMPDVARGLAFAAGVWVGIATWFAMLLLFARPEGPEMTKAFARRVTLGGAACITSVGFLATLCALSGR